MRRKDAFKKVFTAGTVAALAAALTVGCGSKGASSDKVVIGSKNFTENEIVAEIYALALEDAGIDVERKFDISSSVVHTAITSDEIDLYPEYTGTGLIAVLEEDPITDAQAVYDEVKKQYEDKFKITWLDYSPANDGQGLVIRTAAAEKYNISTISDLQKHATELRFASQGEFDERADGIPALEKVYGPFDWKSSTVYDNSLKYQILEKDEGDVIPASTTEGNLVDDQFTLLEDDKYVWPPYNLAPIVRDEVLKAHPEIEDTLNKISPKITTEEITKLNAKVDVDKESYKDVAKEFYDSIK